ncbi:helix-turn-helix domain-containing protein [Polaromonas sp.]|uniref:helix-turn-helix domain-containing protein n=1 Tax=Polaromonas sp. TaxID=1869339 RepID=UPI00352BBBD0
MNLPQPPDDEAPSQAAQLVRALLERHGLPKHRHASFVGEFFNLSRAAAHQRVTKSSAWTLDDFQALANRFGETLAQVLGASSTSDSGHAATLRVGGMEMGCRIWLAEDGDPSPPGKLVAMENAGVYVVVPAVAAVGQELLRVKRLEIDDEATPAPRVAVFDDERDVANSVCGMLRASGIDAVPYYAAETLLADIPQGLFDGYVVDWMLPGNKTSVALLAAVRGLPEHRAAVLLSGKTRNGTADPHEVGAATTRFKIQMVEKPVQPPTLVSALVNDGLSSTRHAGPLSA